MNLIGSIKILLYTTSLLSFCVIEIYCQCKNQGVLRFSKYREHFFPNTIEKCRDWIIGPFNVEKSFFVLFDTTNSKLNCPYDNAFIYDEMRNVIFDFCKKYNEKYISYLKYNARYLFIEFNHGSREFFSLGIEWWIVDLIPNPTNIFNTTTKSSSTTKTTLSTTLSTNIKNNCGIPSIQMIPPFSRISLPRIIGGFNVVPNSHPWQVYLTDYTGFFSCGGSIINENYILTAAHCVFGYTSNLLRAYVGAHDLSKSETGVRKLVKISKIIMHPSYNALGKLDNDIALLKLESQLVFNKEISSICLPFKRPVLNSVATITGWGFTKDGGPPSFVLRQVSINIRDNSFCRNIGITSTSQICTINTVGTGSLRDSCQGDSGGPMIQSFDNRYYLTGIISFGGERCDGVAVYTNVFSYVDWIIANM